MKRAFSIFLILLAMMLVMIPVMADTTIDSQEPVGFHTTITVDSDGGRYQVGFVNVEFKKRFLDKDFLPETFEAEVYADNGQVFIEFNPDTVLFFKKVHLRVEAYSGYLFDRATGENIYVEVKKQQILAPHFSKYCIYD